MKTKPNKKSLFGLFVRWFLAPRRRIRELRIDLAAVRKYNAGLANENYKLRTELDGLGELIITEIIKQGMFAVNHPDPDEKHVFVWAANAPEQLECAVSGFLSRKCW
jgi:hypothetical protein